MKTITILLVATVLSGSAWGREKSTSICHLFSAWAMAQLCPHLTLKHTAGTDSPYKIFSDNSRPMRPLQNDALRNVRHLIAVDPKTCHPQCTGTDDDEGTPCQYLNERK
jgi:hypothetical protein